MTVQSNDGQLTAVNFMTKHQLVAAGTATFAGIDVMDFIGDIKLVLSMINPAADGSTGSQISLLQSSDNTTFSTWANAPTFALATGATTLVTVSLDTRNCQRYVQAKHVTTGTTATFTSALIGVGTKQVQ